MSAAIRNKRANKTKESETAKNNELRETLLKEIAKLCEDMPDLDKTFATNLPLSVQNEPEQIPDEVQIIKIIGEDSIQRLSSLWGQHGFLLVNSTIGSDINTRDFLEAFFPTLTKGDSEVINLAVSNFELVLDLSGESFIPHIKSLVAKIKHYAHDRLIFFKLMAMVVWRYGRWLDIYTEFDNYLKAFEEDKIVEALDLLAALINTCGLYVKEESLSKILSLLTIGPHLRTNTHYLKTLNELFSVWFHDLPLKEVVDDLLTKTQGRSFLDQEYNNELEKCRLLTNTAFLL